MLTNGEVFREIFLHDHLTRFDCFFEMSQFHVLSEVIVNVSSKRMQLALPFRSGTVELGSDYDGSDMQCCAVHVPHCLYPRDLCEIHLKYAGTLFV